MSDPSTLIYIVDDDLSIRIALSRLVRSARMQPRSFASVDDFMRSEISDNNACVVSEIQLPGISGLDLLVLLARAGHRLPVIFVTDQDALENRDRAKCLGASAYFRKPVDGQALLDAIAWVIIGKST